MSSVPTMRPLAAPDFDAVLRLGRTRKDWAGVRVTRPRGSLDSWRGTRASRSWRWMGRRHDLVPLSIDL
jgi:hypothetical protein